VKIHIGQTVENAVRGSGMSITAISHKLNVSRKTIYNYFEDPELDLKIVKRFEQILHTSIISQDQLMVNYNNPEGLPLTAEKEAAYWRAKYIDLLERYTQLLEKK
jgi:predicted transcriptional regulator